MSEYSEIVLAPNSTVTPLGNCRYEIDGRVIEFAIRKLTPTECFTLMDVPKWAIEKMTATDENGRQIISNSQLYKMAGNSIVVSVLENIFSKLFYPEESTGHADPRIPKQLSLF